MRRNRVDLALAVTAVVLGLLPLVVAVATRAGREWLPIQDLAITDMRVRDVWSTDVPLVGPYSRYLWNHPGPLMFWILALPSAVSGQAAWGTLVGGVLLQAVAVVWAGVLGWRSGRLPTVLVTMLVVVVTYRSIGPLAVLEPWNPHIALPWFVLFGLYAWRLCLGELRRLPGAVFVATFLVQTHVGYLPLIAAAALVVVACRALDHRQPDVAIEPVSRRTWLVTAAVAVVLWAPVVVEQFRSDEGNLTRLWDYFVRGEGTEPSAGLRAALGLAGSAFRVPPPWLGGREPHDFGTAALVPGRPALILIPIALLALGYVGARRARDREHERLVLLTAAVFVAGVLALARVTGELIEYLFYWRVPLAAAVVVCAVIGVADLVREHVSTTRAARWGLTGVVVAALATVSLSIAVRVGTADAQVRSFEREVEAVLDQIDLDELRDETVLVRFDGSTLGGLQGGVVDALDREGVEVRVDEDLGFQFGEHRAANARDVDTVWYAFEDGVLTSLATIDPRARFIARLEPLGPDEEAEVVELQLRLLDQLEAAGRGDLRSLLDSDLVAFGVADVPGVDLESAARLGELNGELRATERCRCSIVAYDPGDS
jgi:hypothetical protein